MIVGGKRNPILNMRYWINKHDTDWVYEDDMESVYNLSHKITMVSYPGTDYLPFYFDNLRNFDKIMEEMIHACLPAPDERFDQRGDEYAWKEYLHSLLYNDLKIRKGLK